MDLYTQAKYFKESIAYKETAQNVLSSEEHKKSQT